MNVILRSVRKEDHQFLFELYASTRKEELAPLGWAAAQQESFLRMQFNAQTQHYRNAYPEMESQIILHNEQKAGRFLVARLEDEIRLVDIGLLPEHCNAGIGTMLIGKLLDEARQISKPVWLHVEAFNRAQRLYERLGFQEVSSIGVYVFMEWLPDEVSSVASSQLAEVNG